MGYYRDRKKAIILIDKLISKKTDYYDIIDQVTIKFGFSEKIVRDRIILKIKQHVIEPDDYQEI